MLLFDKIGRLILTHFERVQAWIIVGLLASSIVVLAAAGLARNVTLLALSIYLMAAMFPVAMYTLSRLRRAILALGVLYLCIGLATVGSTIRNDVSVRSFLIYLAVQFTLIAAYEIIVGLALSIGAARSGRRYFG
jgi:hypothetical protein